MTFTVVFSSGSIDSNYASLEESAGLQFSDSVVNLFPDCDLLLLTDVNQSVFHSLSSEFTINATAFGSVCTKQTLNHWMIQTPTCSRFNVNAYTVTFGKYNSLYSLENEMQLLQSVPFYRAHFFCLVLQRCSNWRAMLYHCCSILQIQFPQYQKKKCHFSPYIVLMGWQRPAPLLCSQPLLIFSPLQLIRPLQVDSGLCNQWMRTYNDYPVYVYISCPSNVVSPKKKWPLLAPSNKSVAVEMKLTGTSQSQEEEGFNPFVCDELRAKVVDSNKQSVDVASNKQSVDVASNKQSEDTIEDWVLTAVCIEE